MSTCILRWSICLILTTFVSSQESEFRLPKSIEAINYLLELKPNYPDANTFDGEEYIQINILPSYFNNTFTNFEVEFNLYPGMTINAAQFEINDDVYELTSYNDNNIDTTQIVTATFDITLETLEPLVNAGTNTFTLYMSYSGTIYGGSTLAGWYQSIYTSESNDVVNLVTQFQATDARRAFPCFDEPAFKSTFDITFIAPENAIALSNMPEISRNITGDNDCTWTGPDGITGSVCHAVTFATTPIMSTYLLAFVIGGYEDISQTSNNVDQSVYYPPIYPSTWAQFALTQTIDTLQYFGEQFEIPYEQSGINKLDSLAVSDFAAGAMENWGMIIYRASRLLVDEDTSSLSSQRGQILIIAHELAHQWFGNLVSPDWWDDLWLNEGFATFMAFEGANEIQPNYDIYKAKYLALSNVQFTDSSVFTHAVQTEIDGDPSNILAQFDSITYQKGMGVINTISNYMTFDTFMDGITAYLTDYAFDTATSEQLAEQLDEAAGTNGTISDMMTTYITESGYPLLHIRMRPLTGAQISVTITQQRMVKQGPAFYDDPDSIPFVTDDMVDAFSQQTWNIPMTIEPSSGADNAISVDGTVDNIMSEQSLTSTFDRIIQNGVEYYLFNPRFSNYFSVFYDAYSMSLITTNFELLGSDNQVQIISDRYLLMMSQYISPESYLNWIQEISRKLIDNLATDVYPDFAVWSLITQSLVSIDDMFCELDEEEITDYNQLRLYFREFARDILTDVLREIVDDINNPFEINEDAGNDNDAITLQSVLLSGLARFGEEHVLLSAYDQFFTVEDVDPDTDLPFMQDGLITNISSNVLQSAFEAVLAYNTDDSNILDYILEIYDASSDEQKGYILNSLGAVYESDELIDEALDFILISGSVRSNMVITGLNSFKTCLGRYKLWQRLTENDGAIYDSLWGSGSIFVQEPLTSMPSMFAGIGKYFEISEFYNDDRRTNAGTQRVVNQTLENVYSRYLWIDNQTQNMQYYMRDYIVNKYEDSMEIWQIIVTAVFCCIGLGLVVLAFWLPSKPSDRDRIQRAIMSSKRLRKRTLERSQNDNDEHRKSSQGPSEHIGASLGHSLDKSLRPDQQNKNQQLSDEVALVDTSNNTKKTKKGGGAAGMGGYGSTEAFDYERLKDDDEHS